MNQNNHPALLKLTKAEQALASASDLSDIKKIIDIAEAARVYARAAHMGEGFARQAEELKLKAQRKAGECLTRLQKGKGGRKNSGQPVRSSQYRETIEDSNIQERSARRWQQVAAIPTVEFNKYIATDERELTTSGLLQEHRRKAKEQKREQVRETNSELVAGVRDPLEFDEHYQTIVVDPPWDWGDEGDQDQLGRARPVYQTMPIEEIAALPIGELAERNAHLYMWITNRSLPKGFALLEGWGFRYITMLTWVKPSFGMGNYFRGSTEQVLFGVRGALPLLRKDCPTHFLAERPGKHSSKPPEFYAMVETCSPGPWLEMFARSPRAGWVAWGAEVVA